MTRLWMFGARVALAASYLTIAVTDHATAAELAMPYAGGVFVVALIDLQAVRAARAQA